jgi:hypothetical protein
MSAPEVPQAFVERLRPLCLGLPETTERVDKWAYNYEIRRRSFCLFVAPADPSGKPVPLLVIRADPDEREVLLAIGHPFFAARNGRDRLGILLSDATDWEEIGELVTESYRMLAPKKLAALLD